MGNMPGVVIGVEKPGWMHARAMQIRTEPGPMHQSRSNSRHQWPDLRDAQGRNPRDPGKRQRELCQCCPSRVSALIDTLKKNQSKGALPEDEQQEMKSLPVKEEKDNNKELNQALKGLRKARKDVQDSFEARSTLHAQWRKFLSLSVTQWQRFRESIPDPGSGCDEEDFRSPAGIAGGQSFAGQLEGDCRALPEPQCRSKCGRCGSRLRRRIIQGGGQRPDAAWLRESHNDSGAIALSGRGHPRKRASCQESKTCRPRR